MKNLLRLSCFLTFFYISTLASMSFAQGPPSPWTVVPQAFTGEIHIVKFLDAVGAPLEGFVADDTGISYTTNGGTTWTRATIMSPFLYVGMVSGYITDITFKDPAHGFAVVDSVYNANANKDAGILITSDSGKIWTFDDTLNTPDSGRGIYYNPANNRLFVASCDRGLVYSSDLGGTWHPIDSVNKFYTGFAFNGNGYGVVATEGTTCSNNGRYNYWLYTTNGGTSWQTSRMNTQSWQPVGIPTTEAFLGASTNSCVGDNNAIYRSDDGGYAFAPLEGSPKVIGDTMSEAMAGDGCELFASSFAVNEGMYVSTNDGSTWSLMTQAPHPNVDTRFYVSPDTIWSFTGDSLYSAVRPPTPDIHVWPDTIAFKNAACLSFSDTTIHIFGCNCANNLKLIGDSIFRTSDDTGTAITTLTPKIPPLPQIPLCVSGIGVDTAVRIAFQPNTDNSTVDDFHLYFSDNGATVDTVIHMTANGIQPKIIGPTGTINLSGPACSGVIDTCLEFVNESCTEIILDGSQSILNEDPQCENELQMTGYCQLNKLPQGIPLLPGESWCFTIDYVPGLKVGCCDASVQIAYKTPGSSTDSLTTLFTVNGCTTTNLKPVFRGFNIKANSCCPPGVPDDTTIYFANLTCDTIELYNPVIKGLGAYNGNFQIANTGPFAVHFPIYVPPGQHVGLPILIACEATTVRAVVDFHYTIRASFSSGACVANIDSTLFETDDLLDTLTLSVQKATTPATITASVNFGSINCCDTTENRTITITGGCERDTITEFAISTPNGNFYLDTVGGSGLPIDLAPGQKITFQVGFNPLCGSNKGREPSGTVTVTETSEGVKGTLTTSLAADTTNEPTASLSTYLMGFDSARSCAGQSCNTLTLTNASCGSVTMSLLTPPVNPAFTVSTVSASPILQGGTTTVSVCLNPSASKVTGALQDSAIFQATANGESSQVTLVLTGYIEPPVPGYIVTQLAPETICDSASTTESFSVTDTGSCYTYDIVSISTGNPQVIVTPPSPLPVHIDSGAAQSFTVTFAPTSIGTFTGTITLTDSDGTTILVPYNFTDTNCTVQHGRLVFTLATDSIVTPNCTTGHLNFTLDANGGTGTVTNVGVTGSGQFAASPSTGTMPFTGMILFDPNQNGSDSAMATVNFTIDGVDSSISFEVYGVVVGVKDSARIGVVGVTPGCINPNDTMLDTFAVILRDPVPDSLGVNTLSFIINYDGDLLFNPATFDLAPGWSIKSITDENDGIHITLSYAGNASGTTPANTTLLMISQLGAISDSVTSTARMTNAHFNDSMFEACTLKALSSSGDSANICIDTSSCGGRLLQPAMAGNLQPVTNIQVVPNPVHKGSSASTLHFTTNLSANVTADVLDVLGHSVVTLTNGAMEPGDHTLAIPTDQIPEGAYFARIAVNGITVIRQFVLEKE